MNDIQEFFCEKLGATSLDEVFAKTKNKAMQTFVQRDWDRGFSRNETIISVAQEFKMKPADVSWKYQLQNNPEYATKVNYYCGKNYIFANKKKDVFLSFLNKHNVPCFCFASNVFFKKSDFDPIAQKLGYTYWWPKEKDDRPEINIDQPEEANKLLPWAWEAEEDPEKALILKLHYGRILLEMVGKAHAVKFKKGDAKKQNWKVLKKYVFSTLAKHIKPTENKRKLELFALVKSPGVRIGIKKFLALVWALKLRFFIDGTEIKSHTEAIQKIKEALERKKITEKQAFFWANVSPQTFNSIKNNKLTDINTLLKLASLTESEIKLK